MNYEYVGIKSMKHLIFNRFKYSNKKTYDVIVHSKDVVLGVIKWYAPWRRYVFFPDEGTLYDAECQITIGEYLQELMKERKK